MPVITQPINSPIPTAGAGTVAPVAQVLQPGTIVDAQVLATRANLVKIAVTGLLLEVMSEVQLQPGMTLKLAVSQTADGLRLAVVDKQLPDQAARAANLTGPAPQAATSTNATTTNVTLSPARVVAPSLQPGQAPVRAVSAEPPLALQAAAVSQAVRAAAPVQASLSSLFANLPVIVASPVTPPDVSAAATQLLATRAPLTESLSAADVRTAFRASGVLLEAAMATGAPAAAASGLQDLKAALTVFRQLVANWSASEGKPLSAVPASALQQSGGAQQAQATPVPVIVTDEPVTAQPSTIAVPPSKPNDASVLRAVTLGAVAITDSPEAPLVAGLVRDQQNAMPTKPAGTILPHSDEPFARSPTPALLSTPQAPARSAAEPPPPFRGSAPSVQPIAAPSIDPAMPAPHLAAQLLDQTDGALARQTLLQVASLPERFDAASTSQPQQRWAFEIPFATPQGTAVAQFEIAGDDSSGTAEAGAPKRVWRARFTLDIETTGPVHALVSLTGEKTSVRMWAERADTAAQLRASTEALDSALRLADLRPGDIVVQDGQPPQAKPARAGHFLDRAT